jgi:hypothetical protein
MPNRQVEDAFKHRANTVDGHVKKDCTGLTTQAVARNIDIRES